MCTGSREYTREICIFYVHSSKTVYNEGYVVEGSGRVGVNRDPKIIIVTYTLKYEHYT